MAKQLFTDFEPIRNTAPMINTRFWKWLQDQVPETVENFVDTIHLYFKGFDSAKHRLCETQLEYHQIVFDRFWWHTLNPR